MGKSPFLKQKRERISRFCGGRAVLVFETDLPVGECEAVRHFGAMASALLQYADEKLVPVAASELEMLVGEARGYDFSLHKLYFSAKPHVENGCCRVRLHRRHTRGKACLCDEYIDTFWSEDGSLQIFPRARVRKRHKNKI